MSFDAFVCCTQAEQTEAGLIRTTLEQGGIRCVIAPRDIRPGHQPIMILLLTRNTNDSGTVETEVGRAVYRGFPLLVVRLDSVPPGKRLAYYLTSRPFHRIDAVTPPLAQHLPRLLNLVESILGVAPSNTPAPPFVVPPPGIQGAPSLDRSGVEGTLKAAGAAPASGDQMPSPGRRERVAFISYTPEDDEASNRALLGLRERIHSELQLQFGCEVRLWQNKHTIPQGMHWNAEVQGAIGESDFFIPVVTPGTMASEACAFEYRQFLAQERILGRDDLIFPLLYVDVPDLESGERRDDPRLKLIRERRWTDWREFRSLPATSPDVAGMVARFCGGIASVLGRGALPTAI